MHFVNQFLQARFGFGRALEREQQVIENQAVGDGAAIVFRARAAGVVFPVRVTSLDSSIGPMITLTLTGFASALLLCADNSTEEAAVQREIEHRIENGSVATHSKTSEKQAVPGREGRTISRATRQC